MPSKRKSERKRSDRLIYKVVLTGGPCGRKTVGQRALASHFTSKGWKVYCVPDVGRLIFGTGLNFSELNEEQAYSFEKNLLGVQIRMENIFFDLAEANGDEKVLVICDRGAMDPLAYVPESRWKSLLRECNIIEPEVCARYDQIVHMASAANDVGRLYTNDNKIARSQGQMKAEDLDRKTRLAWKSHKNLDDVGNDAATSSNAKMDELIETVSSGIARCSSSRHSSGTNFISLHHLLLQELAELGQECFFQTPMSYNYK